MSGLGDIEEPAPESGLTSARAEAPGEPEPDPDPAVPMSTDAGPEPSTTPAAAEVPVETPAQPEPETHPGEAAPAPEEAEAAIEHPAPVEDAPTVAEETPPATATATVPVATATPHIGDVAAPDGITPPPVVTPPVPRPVTETSRIMEGVVTAVSPDWVELTLDDGRPAVISRRNFGLNDEEPSAVLSVGDRCFGAELAREDPKSRVVLSRSWALKRQAWEKVVAAGEKNELVTGKVVATSKKGLVVDVGVRGFIPSSHLELNPVSDLSAYVDQTLELKILEVDPRKEKLVLSRRALLLRAQRREMQQLMGELKPGEIRTGTVASLADYGAFVDLGGVSGLVHISELSWQRVGKPSDVVSVGDSVEVKILDVKPKKKRISLSIRQTAPDPLLSVEVGSVITGRVSRLVDFGAFVSIGDFEGLVHLSELAEYRVSTPEEIVAPGDEVGVTVLSVDRKRRRIELSIRRAAEYRG